LPDFPDGRGGAIGGLNFNEEPIICGGSAGYTLYKSCWIYKSGAWTTSTPLTIERNFASYTDSPFPGQKLFVIGGRNFISTPPLGDLKTIEYLTTSGWVSSTVIAPVTFERHCSVLFNPTSVMVIGGITSQSSNSDQTYIYSLKTNAWTKGPTLVTGIIYFARYPHITL
jgi:Galactose oxidase, central domain